MKTIEGRNIIFSNQTNEFIENLTNKAKNENVKKYIKSNIKRWLINKYENISKIDTYEENDPIWLKNAIDNNKNIYKLNITPMDKDKIFHWIDYLNTLNGDLSRISIDQLQLKVEMWDKSFQKIKEEVEDGIEIIHKYENGYSWVKIFGEKSLNREGAMMNHCVGSYYSRVKENKTSIYSLRYQNNKPHCTIEICNKEVKQIKGNSNEPVNEKYVEYVRDFLKNKYVPFIKISNDDLPKIGLISINDKIYSLNGLPNGLNVEGYLNLSNTNITSLPEDLKVEGYLDLSNTNITSLPENLKVGGSLYLSKTNITSLPKGLRVGGNLNLSDTNITSLSENLKVEGYLALSNTNITSLPKGLRVGGNLYLSKTNITSLPEDLEVGGNILDITKN